MNDFMGPLLGWQANADREHTEATTRLDLANAQAVETRTRQDAQMMELARQSVGTIGTSVDPVDKIETVANRLLDAGYYNQGTAIGQKAGQMRLQRQQALTSKARQGLDEINAQIKEHEELANFLGMATDPESYQQAKMMYMSSNPGNKIPPQLEQYNPALVDALHRSTTKGLTDLRDRERAYHDQVGELQKDAELRDRKAGREFSRETQEKVAKLREELRSRRVKSEGKEPIVGTPNREMIQAAQSMVKELHPGLADDMPLGKDSFVSSAAYDVASPAKGLMTKNRGLSSTEAMQQALTQLQGEGRFQDDPGEPGTKIGGFTLPFGGKKPSSKYSRAGGASPLESGPILPLPPKSDKPLPPGKYKTPKGIVLWDGKSGKIISAKQAIAPNTSKEEETDDEGVRTP